VAFKEMVIGKGAMPGEKNAPAVGQESESRRTKPKVSGEEKREMKTLKLTTLL